LLEIYFNNTDNINLEFSFGNSGTAKITKKNNKSLNQPKQTISSENYLKKIFKKIYMKKPKK